MHHPRTPAAIHRALTFLHEHRNQLTKAIRSIETVYGLRELGPEQEQNVQPFDLFEKAKECADTATAEGIRHTAMPQHLVGHAIANTLINLANDLAEHQRVPYDPEQATFLCLARRDLNEPLAELVITRASSGHITLNARRGSKARKNEPREPRED